MTEDYVPYKLAVKLKEKGYPQRCCGKYDMIGACYFKDGRFYEDGCIAPVEDCFTAPRIDQVLKWLRKEKNFYVVPLICSDADGIICEEWLFWSYRVININDGRIVYDELDKNWIHRTFEGYEQAALAGIEYTLYNLV